MFDENEVECRIQAAVEEIKFEGSSRKELVLAEQPINDFRYPWMRDVFIEKLGRQMCFFEDKPKIQLRIIDRNLGGDCIIRFLQAFVLSL